MSDNIRIKHYRHEGVVLHGVDGFTHLEFVRRPTHFLHDTLVYAVGHMGVLVTYDDIGDARGVWHIWTIDAEYGEVAAALRRWGIDDE